MKAIKTIFWFLWGLPQNLIGGLMFIFLRKNDPDAFEYKDSYIVQAGYNGPSGAVSLGMFIFLFRDYKGQTERIIKHEYGHSIQSKILGPLYLLIIGLPSIIWAAFFGKYRKKHKISYYSFFPEKWADKLGGVNNEK